MTKRVNYLPNERLDIPDIQQGTDVFSADNTKHHWERWVLDNFPRISDGFRIEIADQTISPGQFTVHNGVAFGRDGQIINNEDDINAARSFTLVANATYFVEIMFILNDSTIDSRAFWDPTFDNGVDPSGDTRMPGKEFVQNVATRKSPDWQIVTPISTTGFDVTSNPNSLKIPVAVITRTGGVIVSATTASARSTLKSAAIATATSIKVQDSRIMPDAFTVTITEVGGSPTETKSITANDRENGVLTLGAGLTNAYGIGARVAVAGATPPQFLVERLTSTLPSSGTADARLRHWQGNEELGYGLLQDPATSSGRADIQVKTLKEYVDFLAGQIREMRWGSASSARLGTSGPPTVSSFPRYWDYSGSIAGSRTATVTVGDGISSWGDFNVTGFTTAGSDTSFKLALQAAHDALPAAGGIIYIKGATGTYQVGTNTPTFTKAVKLVGDGSAVTRIEAFQNSYALIIGSSSSIDGIEFTTSTSFASPLFKISNSSSTVSVHNCLFTAVNNNVTALVEIGSSCNHITFDKCVFNASGNSTLAITVGANTTFVKVQSCSSTVNGGLIKAISGNTNFEINSNDLTFTSVGTLKHGIHLELASVATSQHKIFNNKITQTGTRSGTAGVGLYLKNIQDSYVRDNIFNQCDYGLQFDGTNANGNIVSECKFLGTTNIGRFGVRFDCTIAFGCHIDHCSFVTLLDNTEGMNAGVILTNGTSRRNWVTNNEFLSIGDGTVNEAYAVYCSQPTSQFELQISHNEIENIEAAVRSEGIRLGGAGATVDDVYGSVQINDNTINVVGTIASTTSTGIIVTKYEQVVIANNTIDSIGWTGATNAKAILIGDGDGATFGKFYSITGNHVLTVRCAFNSLARGAGIAVQGAGLGGIIADNTISISSINVAAAIFIAGGAVGSPFTDTAAAVISDTVVKGNVIMGNSVLQYGVHIRSEVANDTQARFVVSDNVVRDTIGFGVSVQLGDIVDAPCVTISGNIIYSIAVNYIGIYVVTCSKVAITGNSIELPTQAVQNYGIKCDTLRRAAVTGNSIGVFPTVANTTWPVWIKDCTTVAVTGNLLNTVYDAVVSDNSHVISSGNMAAPTGGGIYPYTAINAGVQMERGKSCIQGNMTTNPTGTNDVGLDASHTT